MAYTDIEIADMRRATDATATAESLYRLGLIYSCGQGAPIDLVEAHKWFNLAAMRGMDAAKAYRRECADMMSKAEIAAAQRAAREWLNISGDQAPPPVVSPSIALVKKPEPAPAKAAAKAPVRQTQAQKYARLRRIVGSPPVFAA
jgi:hypothetical protein